MRCPKCNMEIPDDALYCNKCGKKILIIKCPNCQEDNFNNAYFCHHCGKRLKMKINIWLICSIVIFIMWMLYDNNIL